MRAVHRGAIAALLALLALAAVWVMPLGTERETRSEEYTPEIEAVVAAETPPETIIIPAPEGYTGDLGGIWVAIPVDGLLREG